MELTENVHIKNITTILKQFPNYHIEGNLLCDKTPDNWDYERNNDKIRNLQIMSKNKKKIIEIGVNACHSLLIMLLENPTAEYLLFDLNVHPYTEPTLRYVKEKFPTTKITVVFGDSTKTITQYIADNPMEWNTYDLCHLDGGHTRDIFSVDYENMKHFMTKKGIVIFDDYDYPEIHSFIQEKMYEIKEVNSIKTPLHFIYTYV
jgi:predicted O-methyltransferase YrrM